MSRLQGLFRFLPGLENISIENVIEQLDGRKNPKILQNQLCNRLFYSQSRPGTLAELKMDLAVLGEVVKQSPQHYYNYNLNAIYIPELLLEWFPDLSQLVWVFAKILGKGGITTVFLKTESLGTRNLGTILKPEIISNTGSASIWVDNKEYKAEIGSLRVIGVESSRVDIKFECHSATILGKNQLATEVVGGKFGIALDLR